MTLSLNDEPERLMVLPPLTSDVRDKIIALKVNKDPMPMPTVTPELMECFWNTLVSELPAFVHFMENWTIPAEIADSRYGVCAFQHFEIVEELDETTPENRLLEMIDGDIFRNRNNLEPWTGTAAELSRHLQRETSNCSDEARRMFTRGAACGSYLGRLEDSTAAYLRGRVSSRRVTGYNLWRH
jgi:hypothetical protein